MMAWGGGSALFGTQAQREAARDRSRIVRAFFNRTRSVDRQALGIDRRLVTGLDADQARAVDLATGGGSGVLVVTGEAGSGKTEVLRVLAEALEIQGKRMAVLAVAHRALHVVRCRLSNSSNVQYLTLARVLRTPSTLRGAAVVVVEEASMVDDVQMVGVLRALDSNAQLVLVGDPHQLPPMAAGTPFRTAISSGVPVVRLRGQYRQISSSGVREFARAIRNRESLERLPGEVRLHCDLEQPLEGLVRVVLEAGRHGSVPLVLTWRRDDWISANIALQQTLNPSGLAVGSTVMRGTKGVENEVELRVGDRVASTENLSGVDFYNGMTGEIRSVSGG
ncbi:MAG TPA: AAA family ATPase, partial [Beutenbergiaceae bacterium]|nr:AAA family ATPase [Beutenbergiaceae bacterium]